MCTESAFLSVMRLASCHSTDTRTGTDWESPLVVVQNLELPKLVLDRDVHRERVLGVVRLATVLTLGTGTD
jgi:hypothetical protein